jgi:alkaline phosphatase
VNLIDRARRAGYRVVFNRTELLALPAGTTRVLGLFTADDTFNDESEETLRQQNRPLYAPTAPAIDDMTRAALRVLQATGRRFFLVSEEEATDNFAGDQNAKGVFEALRRADRAIGVALDFQRRNPRTLILTAADSDCGGMQVLSVDNANAPIPARDEETGAMLDGREGTGSLPFLSAPDARGQRFPFAVAWSAGGDMAGGIAARAHGLNAALLPANVQNTDIFRLSYRTLFGRWPRR